MGFPCRSAGKESTCNAGDLGSIPGLGRSPGGGHGNPLQYSCLENPHGQRSLVGYNPWGCKESDMTEHEYCTLLRGRTSAPDVEHVLRCSVVSDSLTPWTVSHQAPLSMGILQARILQWVVIPSSRGSSQPRDRTQVSCNAGRFFRGS